MKNIVKITLLSFIISTLLGCGNPDRSGEKSELVVFAAASMTETLTELGDAFMRDHANVHIIYNFDSSGTLKTQIQEGADVDIFISAGQKQMDQLDCALAGTRCDILENTVVLAVPEGNPADVHSYEDMVEGLREGTLLVAIGNADVPVGQYTQKIFAYYGLTEAELAAGNVTYCSNAKEVTTQVAEAAVDCGILYRTDACSAALSVIDTATEEMCGQVIYPAAVMAQAKHPELAREFLEFLRSEEAAAVFANVGFTPIK